MKMNGKEILLFLFQVSNVYFLLHKITLLVEFSVLHIIFNNIISSYLYLSFFEKKNFVSTAHARWHAILIIIVINLFFLN